MKAEFPNMSKKIQCAARQRLPRSGKIEVLCSKGWKTEKLLAVVLEDEAANGAHAEVLSSENNAIGANSGFVCGQKADPMVETAIHLAHSPITAFSGFDTAVVICTPISQMNHLVRNFKKTHSHLQKMF